MAEGRYSISCWSSGSPWSIRKYPTCADRSPPPNRARRSIASSIACAATSSSERGEDRASDSTTWRYRSRVAKSIAAYGSSGLDRSVRSTAESRSTKSRQSIPSRVRSEVIELPIETWSAACTRVSIWTICSMVWPISESRCSTQVRARVRDGARPRSSRASSATKALVMGGSERAISATSRITLFGSCSAISIIRSAQDEALSESTLSAAIRVETRRRFSIRASRSMIGTAQSSPSRRGATVWYASTNEERTSRSTRPSLCAISSRAI